MTAAGQARLARSQNYVNSKKNKTAGQRIRKTLGAGLVGSLIPGAAGAGIGVGLLGQAAAVKGIGLAAMGGKAIGAVALGGAASFAGLMAVGGLTGLTIAALKHGAQARKVKKAKKFIDQYGIHG